LFVSIDRIRERILLVKKKRSNSAALSFILVIAGLGLYLKFLQLPTMNEDVPLPEGLHPHVAQQADLLVQQAADKGISIIITDGFRSFEEQDSLYARGRTSGGSIVTHAQGGESFHNFGLAVDFAILSNNGNPLWDMQYDGNGNGQSDWMEVVGLAKNLGFEWGGDWKHFKDYPHLQMNFGLTIRELQRGKRPPEQPLTVNKNT
jgi:peptidoglycan L-alanyl-D-glutamate endopeptidase CwlK